MVPDAPPIAGTVIRYSYLWKRGADRGRDEGGKDRLSLFFLRKLLVKANAPFCRSHIRHQTILRTRLSFLRSSVDASD
jgi:hypothetical protein